MMKKKKIDMLDMPEYKGDMDMEDKKHKKKKKVDYLSKKYR